MKSAIEPSVISRSQSEASSSNAKSKLLLGSDSKLETIFPLLDQICQNSQLYLFIYHIGAIYLYFQVIISSFYPFHNYWIEVNNREKLNSVIEYLEKVTWFFHVANGKEADLIYPAIINLAIFIVATFFILLEIFGNISHHKIKKISFLIVRFIINIISPVMLIPLSAIVGNSIRNLVLTNDTINWIYLFLGIIFYFCFLIYSYVGFMISNGSTVISLTLFSSFDIKIPLFLPVINSFFVFLQCIFSLFNGWAMVIVQISHIFVCIYVFYSVIFMIFHTEVANAVFIGVILSTIFNDITFSILYFVSKPSNIDESKVCLFDFAGILFPFLSLVISIIISSLFVNFFLRKILNILNNASDSDINDEFFQDNVLFRSENASLMTLHIGFVKGLPIFYSMASFNYISSQFPTIKVFLSIAQYLSFFSGESRQMNIYLKPISQNRSMSYSQRFLLFQIYRIKMHRQSSVSTDANRRFAELKNISNQCYEDLASFWGRDNDDCILFFENMSSEIYHIDKKWEESIRDFPNNQKFSAEYCSFLIECEMDLKKALVMKYRTNLIEMGKNFTVDIPFIRFITSFPIYLKNKIIDKNGSINRHNEIRPTQIASSTVSTQNSSSNTNNFTGSGGNALNNSFSSSSSILSSMNLDQEIEENLGRQLFKQTNLRLELHRALDKRKSYASKLIFRSSFVIFLIGFLAFFGIYKYCYFYIDYRYDACYYLNLATKTSSYLDLAILGSTLKFAYFTNRLTRLDLLNELDLKDDENEDQVSLSEYNHEIFKIDEDISYSLIHTYCYLSMDYFYEFLDSLNDLANVYGENIYEFGYLLMHNESPFVSCFDGFPVEKVNMSLKTLEAYLFLVTEQSASIDVAEGNWYNSNEVCELLANQPLFHNSALKLYSNFNNA